AVRTSTLQVKDSYRQPPRIRATIPHEIGAPARCARRSRTALSAVPFLFQMRFSHPECLTGPPDFRKSQHRPLSVASVSPPHPLSTTHHPLSSNYLWNQHLQKCIKTNDFTYL